MLLDRKLSKIVKITNSKLFGKDLVFKRISTDTRTLKKGDLFLALKGENFDGHDFIEKAISKGASSIVSEKDLSFKISYIKTKNNLLFLKKLAEQIRKNFKGTIFAITGSNGKTSTKEISFLILSHIFGKKKIFKSPKNWNNELGLYFSLLELESNHNYAVFELGTNFPGEIDALSKLLKPHHGLITNIGRSHLEFLKNLEGVANEKSELFKNVQKTGFCFVRAQDQFRKILFDKAKGKNLIFLKNDKKEIFDLNFDASIKIIEAALNPEISAVEKNKLKDNIKKIIKVPGRMEQKIGPKNTTIIDDSYNANPDSFSAAFKEISKFNFKKKICVMGKMGELGENSIQLHDSVIKESLNYFDLIFCVDFDSKITDEKIKYILKSEVQKHIKGFFGIDTLILFKASRSVKMESVIKLA